MEFKECPRCSGPACPDDEMGWCHRCQREQAADTRDLLGFDFGYCTKMHGKDEATGPSKTYYR